MSFISVGLPAGLGIGLQGAGAFSHERICRAICERASQEPDEATELW